MKKLYPLNELRRNSLGPVYEFVYTLFRADNLNCFRVK